MFGLRILMVLTCCLLINAKRKYHLIKTEFINMYDMIVVVETLDR